MMLKNKFRWGYLTMVLVLLAGCNTPSIPIPATQAPTQAAATVEATTAPLVMNTATSEITVDPSGEPMVATVTAEPQVISDSATVLEGETSVLSINMRSGPSTVHPVTGTYNIGTVVTILGQTPDHSWYYVQPRDNKFGWMYAKFLILYSKEESIPEIVPSPATRFSGKVINTADQSGVDGVDIAIVQGTGAEILRAETLSTETGEFEVYLPTNISGAWRVVIVGIDCKSKIMGDTCTYTGTFSPDLGITFTLPDIPALQFNYTP
jgi:hypothetical protein